MQCELRKFPFPYICGLSISSDIDNASSHESFLALMDFLNTSKPTPFGKGLGLEIGNSFWFYNNTKMKQLSYFQNNNEESKLAPFIREFWKSGHIDTIHSYGNFDEGGFKRFFAEKSLNELEKYRIKIPVWVNHGIGLNYQKVGNYPDMYGDDPNHKAYHMDLTLLLGCEFFWTGKNTHIIGQDANRTFSTVAKQGIQWVLKNTRYRKTENPIFDNGNNLLRPIKFRDGNLAWEFQRWINSWGRETFLDVNEFSAQINKKIINRLIKNQGVMIIYTHFNENLNIRGLPPLLKKNLRHLKRNVKEKKVFLTTTSRLLKYWEVNLYLNYSVESQNDVTMITIKKNIITPIGEKVLFKNHLQGITFYVNDADKTSIYFENELIDIVKNKKDNTRRDSVTIPWIPLEYPT